MFELLLIVLLGGAVVQAVTSDGDSAPAPENDEGEGGELPVGATLTEAEREEAAAVLRENKE